MKRFDSKALYRTIDDRRLQRGLTWSAVAGEMGVSAATVQRIRLGGRLEVDGMLAMVGWLGESVETFVREETGRGPEAR